MAAILLSGCGDSAGSSFEEGDPVRAPVLWSRPIDGIEAVTAADGTVFVAGWTFAAYDLATGEPVWEDVGDGDHAFEASGGVEIEVSPGTVRVFAPFEYLVTLDRSTGRVLELDRRVGEEPPASFVPTTLEVSGLYDVEFQFDEVIGRDNDGSVVWRTRTGPPEYDSRGPYAAGDHTIVVTAAPELIVIGPRR